MKESHSTIHYMRWNVTRKKGDWLTVILKYKVWDKAEEKFFTPTYRAYDGILQELLLSPSGELAMRNTKEIVHESMFPNRFVIVPFINFLDSDGKEIHVGDILLGRDGKRQGEVVWDKYELGYRLQIAIHRKYEGEEWTEIKTMPIHKDWYKIIGNIFEQPELKVK